MTGAAAFLFQISSRLQECGIEFMVTGSLVSSYYGDSRTTLDIDLVVNATEPPDDSVRLFVASCESIGFYVATQSAFGE